MSPLSIPLQPRRGHGVLRVLIIGRISTEQQHEQNIAASYRYVRDYLSRIYQGEMQIQQLGEQASGMLSDRATIRQAEDLIDAGMIDLVIAEDLSRIYRNPRHQYAFVQDAVDRLVRVICIADNLDTADEHWEVNLSTAAIRHGLFIPDTCRRVRRTATDVFHRGGMVQRVRYGYRKLSREEADSGQFGPRGLRMAKRPECTPVILEMRQLLMATKRPQAVADWLNAEGVEPGPYARADRWTATLVKGLLCDPVLHGTRRFRQTVYRRVYGTGKHRRENNSEPITKQFPELAHMTHPEQEQMLRAVGWSMSAPAEGQAAPSPRRGVPRKRSLWPGQAATCSACGGPMQVIGNHLRCAHSLARAASRCWNHVQVSVEVTRQRAVAWLLDECVRRPEVHTMLVDAALAERQQVRKRSTRGRDSTMREIDELRKQAANLAKAIAQGGQLQALVDQLQQVERELDACRAWLATCEPDRDWEVSRAKDEIGPQLSVTLEALVRSSFDFADLLRRLLPTFVIQPVQALDTPQIRPRGRLHASMGQFAESGPVENFVSVGRMDVFPDSLIYGD
jgi:hypothetical protein